MQGLTRFRTMRPTEEIRGCYTLVHAIAFLEEEIGWALVWYGKPEGARDLLRHAVSDLERSLAKNPADRETQRYLADGTLLSGYLAEDAGEFEEALGCFERTADLRMAVYPGDSMDTCLLEVCRRLPSFSDRFKRDGETRLEERSRRLSRPDTPLLPRLGRATFDNRIIPGARGARDAAPARGHQGDGDP